MVPVTAIKKFNSGEFIGICNVKGESEGLSFIVNDRRSGLEMMALTR